MNNPNTLVAARHNCEHCQTTGLCSCLDCRTGLFGKHDSGKCGACGGSKSIPLYATEVLEWTVDPRVIPSDGWGGSTFIGNASGVVLFQISKLDQYPDSDPIVRFRGQIVTFMS